MNQDCIFCKIIKRQIDSQILYEDENIVAFKDINPQAPFHILIVPKFHIEKISDIDSENSNLVGEMVIVANKIAKNNNLDSKGYRLVFNCGESAGQEVFHIHLHLLGGRKFSWPPG